MLRHALSVEVRIGSGSGQIVKLEVSFGVGSAADQGTLSDTCRCSEE